MNDFPCGKFSLRNEQEALLCRKFPSCGAFNAITLIITTFPHISKQHVKTNIMQ